MAFTRERWAFSPSGRDSKAERVYHLLVSPHSIPPEYSGQVSSRRGKCKPVILSDLIKNY